jgi:hypothetical protein
LPLPPLPLLLCHTDEFMIRDWLRFPCVCSIFYAGERVRLALEGIVESTWAFRLIAPSYTSLYHAVSFSHHGYAEARRCDPPCQNS